MNYKKLRDWNSGFHDWVIKRHPTDDKKQNGFMGGFIIGERGQGKSTYCYKVMAKIYYTLNGYTKTDEEEDAYKQALDCMIYHPKDFLDLIMKNKIVRTVTPVITLDDASMHFSTMLHQKDVKLYDALQGEIVTVRTAVTGLLINSPKRCLVAKFLREQDDFKGETVIDSGNSSKDFTTWNRKIRYYKWRYFPDEKKYRIQIPFQDKYSCYIPDEFYSWYTEKKRYYEILHGIEIADKFMKGNREIFINNKDKLPKELSDMVSKWKV